MIARTHARPAIEFALQRLEFLRHLEQRAAARQVTDDIFRKPYANLQGDLLGERQLRLDALDVVVGDAGALRRRLHGVVEQTELVDEPLFLGVAADPHAPLCDGVDLVAGFLASRGDVRQEFLVPAFYDRLQQDFGILAHRAIDAQLSGELRGADTIDMDADLAERALEVGDRAEDADRAGNGCRMRPDLIRGRRNVVATRRRQIAHRNDHGLAVRLRGAHFAIDLLR